MSSRFPYFRDSWKHELNGTWGEPDYRSHKLNKILEIMNKKLINTLIKDRYFDIYTRNGFEYLMEEACDNAKLYLLDFDDVRGMNKELGYTKVNDIFKKAFTELKSDYVIGRAFSGDEIFFHTFKLTDEIDTIRNVCDKYNLTFDYIEQFHRNGYDIKTTLEKMIEKFH